MKHEDSTASLPGRPGPALRGSEPYAHRGISLPAGQEPELLLWPHRPGVEDEWLAQPSLMKLVTVLATVPSGLTPAGIGRFLGARVMIAEITPPRWGWTWYRARLIEVARWLEPLERQITIAHEVCHWILGPPPASHDPLTERVCNWGASRVLRRAVLPC